MLDGDDKTVTQIDPETSRVRRVFGTSSRPTDIAAGAGAVWVGNGPNEGLTDMPASVSRIDPSTNRVVARIEAKAELIAAGEGDDGSGRRAGSRRSTPRGTSSRAGSL